MLPQLKYIGEKHIFYLKNSFFFYLRCFLDYPSTPNPFYTKNINNTVYKDSKFIKSGTFVLAACQELIDEEFAKDVATYSSLFHANNSGVV